MSITNPVVSLVGNSEAINKLDEPLRSQVIALYTAFWKVWDSATSPLEFGALGALFLPFFIKLILCCFPEDFRIPLFVALSILYGHSGRALFVEYRIMYREGLQEFDKLLQELPEAKQALRILFRIEPWRIALLKHILVPTARAEPTYKLRLF